LNTGSGILHEALVKHFQRIVGGRSFVDLSGRFCFLDYSLMLYGAQKMAWVWQFRS
jgi:hypothetical protein